MNFLSLIEAKRDGKELTRQQVQDFVSAFTAGSLPDYQVSAFLMAVYFRGLTTAETTSLTISMRDSGDTLKLPSDPRPVVDKHSTGGVGDKVSLPLAPLLACLGLRVPMISGRGLGITGGTLDKLDSIPGFQTNLASDRIVEIVQEVGCVICGQTDRMVPADKGLYSLRDVTGTVPSQPLIVASILSKKLAENLNALILDVKCGTAAFMPTIQAARELATAMVRLGNQCGVKTRALLTSMDAPLGAAAGNWLEVKESVGCLEGKGPADLESLVLDCAAHLLVLAGKHTDLAEARNAAKETLESGKPRKKWDEMIAAQGADLAAFEAKLRKDVTAPSVTEIKAQREGFVTRADARFLGEIVRDLGGGRLTRESRIDWDVGIDRIARIGSEVKPGEILARVHASNQQAAENAALRVRDCFTLSTTPVPPASIVREVVQAG